jgi:solute carrier family 45, member 1/2/4
MGMKGAVSLGDARAISSPVPGVSHARLVALTAGLAGLQFCWAVQVGYVTRTLLQLQLSERFVSLAWLAGPIAGIVVQPIVGVLSDRCTASIGRRRPFLIGGSVITLFALFSFAYASRVGRVIGTSPLVIAVSSFWVLDFAMNAAQGPLRALMADVVPVEQQQRGNAYFAFMTGIGNFAGNMLGSVPLASIMTMFDDDMQALYVIAMIVLGISMSITVLTANERPLYGVNVSARTHYDSVRSTDDSGEICIPTEHPDPSPSSPLPASRSPVPSVRNGRFRGVFNMLRDAPPELRDIFVMQCFTWFAWFTIFIFATSWVGSDVFNGVADAAPGSPKRLLYEAGVRAGNFGLAMQAVVSTLFSLVLPHIVHAFSARSVLFASHMCLGGALAMTLTLHHIQDKTSAQALLALTGISWATTMTVPWALASEAIMRDAPGKAGQYLTIFNLSQCFPEVLVSVVSTGIESRIGRQAAMLGLGGVFAFAGGAYVLALRVGDLLYSVA